MTVHIGLHWQPTHAVVRDPEAGTYFERNPPMQSSTELQVQSALLAKQRERDNHWLYWVAGIAMLVALVTAPHWIRL